MKTAKRSERRLKVPGTLAVAVLAVAEAGCGAGVTADAGDVVSSADGQVVDGTAGNDAGTSDDAPSDAALIAYDVHHRDTGVDVQDVADAPDCTPTCATRYEWIDGAAVLYVVYADGATSLDASCDPRPPDPRCAPVA